MKKLYLPSLRGFIGDWVYYPTLMKLEDIAERISVDDQISQSRPLDEMVQRFVKPERGKDIRNYLLNQDQRFFNSLIVAVYEGDPSWYDISRIESNNLLDPDDIPDDVVAGIGILSLNGDEKLFTLDGQHRLIGIKEAVTANPQLCQEELSIILIAHKTDEEGMKRSRRLFTTLNKEAVRVSKGEIIALDEDDSMAITVRRLVVENPMFLDKRILNHPTDNIPKSDQTCLTTIGNLYDLLSILFTKIYVISKYKSITTRKKELTNLRQSGEILNKHYRNACDYFQQLTVCFNPLQEFAKFTTTEEFSAVVKKHRHSDGGSILFRPIGLNILTEIVAILVENYSLSDCFRMISKLPTDLSKVPFNHVIWDPSQKTIKRGKTLARNLLLYMLNQPTKNVEKLREDYAKALGKEINEVELPKKVLEAPNKNQLNLI
jgi:DNA sulfur modification protein DndB